MRFELGMKHSSEYTLFRFRKFMLKTATNKTARKIKTKEKERESVRYGAMVFNKSPEFNYYIAKNLERDKNPISFMKTSSRTVVEAVVKISNSFEKTLGKPGPILATVSLEGYLLLYDFEKMEPILSYKTDFGGINSMTFSDNCEWISLSC